MVAVIVKVKLQANHCFFLIDVRFVVMLVLPANSLHQNTRPINRRSPQTRISVDGPSVLMEGASGQHEHHNNKTTIRKKTNTGLQFYFTITTT